MGIQMGQKILKRTAILLTLLPLCFAACGGYYGNGQDSSTPENNLLTDPAEEGKSNFRPVAVPPVMEDPSFRVIASLTLLSNAKALISGTVIDKDGAPMGQGSIGFLHASSQSAAALTMDSSSNSTPYVVESGIALTGTDGHFQFVTSHTFGPKDVIYLVASEGIYDSFGEITLSQAPLVVLSIESPEVDQSALDQWGADQPGPDEATEPSAEDPDPAIIEESVSESPPEAPVEESPEETSLGETSLGEQPAVTRGPERRASERQTSSTRITTTTTNLCDLDGDGASNFPTRERCAEYLRLLDSAAERLAEVIPPAILSQASLTQAILNLVR